MKEIVSLQNPHHALALTEADMRAALWQPQAILDVATVAWKGECMFKDADPRQLGVSQLFRLFTPTREELEESGLLPICMLAPQG